MRRLIALLVALGISTGAMADTKDVLSYPLKQYGAVLAIALLGGVVSWAAKVRAGTLQVWNFMALVGELCTSALAGLLCFWLCEWQSLHPLLTAALIGISGHMGTRAITLAEAAAQRKFGVTGGPAPLDDAKGPPP